ncbi:hypothetical protein C8R47DRAFT_1083830 [Mycena vitilis]|nr:hypothetical protein C8R47DRAFT_1083830 [Mycena vitilis]
MSPDENWDPAPRTMSDAEDRAFKLGETENLFRFAAEHKTDTEAMRGAPRTGKLKDWLDSYGVPPTPGFIALRERVAARAEARLKAAATKLQLDVGAPHWVVRPPDYVPGGAVRARVQEKERLRAVRKATISAMDAARARGLARKASKRSNKPKPKKNEREAPITKSTDGAKGGRDCAGKLVRFAM